MLSVEDNNDGGNNTFRGAYYAIYVKYNPTGSHTSCFSSCSYIIAVAPFMVSIVVSVSTVTFYLGGNLYCSVFFLLSVFSSLSLPSVSSFFYLSLFGPIGGGNGFVGYISYVCLYIVALTSTQLSALSQVGAICFQFLTSVVAFSLAAIGYTVVPSYCSLSIFSGLAELVYLYFTVSFPSTVIQHIQLVEKGLVFVGSVFLLYSYDRSRRIGAAAPAVSLPAFSFFAFSYRSYRPIFYLL